MDKKTKLIWESLFCVLLLLTLTSATTCYSDINCASSEYCDETQSELVAGSYAGTCETINTTVHGLDISCTSGSDCVINSTPIGRYYCDTTKDICTSYSNSEGDSCLIDNDCGFSKACVLSVCTTRGTLVSCTSDTSCDTAGLPNYECVDDFCVPLATLGDKCNYDDDCSGSLICDNTYDVCTECDSSWGVDGGGNIPSGTFCNTQASGSWSWDYHENFRTDFATANDYPISVIEELRDEGDPCYDGGCCASTDCGPNGKCVPLGTGGSVSNTSANFCSEFSNRNLNLEYIDGTTTVTEPVNVTFFQEVFDNDNLRILKPYGGSSRPYDSESFWYRGEKSGLPAYGIWFYDIDTGDVCFFDQYGITLTWKCGDSGVTEDSSNATHAIVTSRFAIDESDFVIVSTGLNDTQGNESAIVFFSKLNSLERPSGSAMIVGEYDSSLTGLDGVISPTFYYKNGVSGSVHSNKFLNNGGGIIQANHDVSSYNRSDTDYEDTWGSYRTNLASITPPYTHYSIEDFTNPPTSPTHWSTYFFTGETETMSLMCCDSDADCLVGWKCDEDTNACYYAPPGTDEITFSLTSVDPKWQSGVFCTDSTTTITVRLKDASGNFITPDGTLTLSKTNGDSFDPTPSSCDSSSVPCTFTIPIRLTNGNNDLELSYDSDSDYADNQIMIELTASDTCHYVTIKTYDRTIETQTGVKTWLSNVKIVMDGGQTQYTASDGHSSFGGLDTSSINFTLSKTGYQTATWEFDSADLDKIVEIGLYQTSDAITEQPLETWNSDISPPTSSSGVIQGLEIITFSFFGFMFPWFMYVIIFIIAITLVKMLFSAVT